VFFPVVSAVFLCVFPLLKLTFYREKMEICKGQSRPEQINQTEVSTMRQTNTTEEIRNNANRLVAKYYPTMGWIEIWQKGERTIITVPVGTPIQICHGDEVSH
jgi:hypothetical protein